MIWPTRIGVPFAGFDGVFEGGDDELLDPQAEATMTTTVSAATSRVFLFNIHPPIKVWFTVLSPKEPIFSGLQ
jgi:hypothetical protein